MLPNQSGVYILYRVRIVPRSHVANELTITEKRNRETVRGLTFGTGHEFRTSPLAHLGTRACLVLELAQMV